MVFYVLLTNAIRGENMTAKEISDNDFIQFQDDFYNLLEKYGVKNITCEHEEWQEICKLRNKVVEFIEQELFKEEICQQEVKQ